MLRPPTSLSISGLAARLGDARTADELWFDLVRERPQRGPDANASSQVGGLDRHLFDPGLFNHESVDPGSIDAAEQVLELTHAAIENSGYDPSRVAGRLGLIAFAPPRALEPVNRKFPGPGLRLVVPPGESMSDALRRAEHCLVSGECDLVVVVGVIDRHLDPDEGGKPAAARQGYALVLRKFSDAENDGDHSWAVLRTNSAVDVEQGSAWNMPESETGQQITMQLGSQEQPLGPLDSLRALVELALSLAHEQHPPSEGRPILAWPRDNDRPRGATLVVTQAAGSWRLLVTEPPAAPAAPVSRRPSVLLWSAQTDSGEGAARDLLARWFVWHGDDSFDDALATSRDARAHYAVRGAAVCTGALDAAGVLGAVESPRLMGPTACRRTQVVFWYPDRIAAGTRIAARALYREVPAFAFALDGWLDRFDRGGIEVTQRWQSETDVNVPEIRGLELEAAEAVAVAAALTQVWAMAGITADRSHGGAIGSFAATAWASDLDASELVDGLRAELTPQRRPDPIGDSEPAIRMVPAGSSGAEAVTGLLRDAAQLWIEGFDIEWTALGQQPLQRRVSLPEYPYERDGRQPDHPDPGCDLGGTPRRPLAAATIRPKIAMVTVRPRIDVLTPPSGGPLVIAIPYAGGAGRAFQSIRRYLPPGCGLGVVDLPGHGMSMGQECVDDVETVVSGLCASLTEVVPDLVVAPPVLLGYSLGGSFAYEVAARLYATGTSPAGLVVCASRAPRTGVGHPPVSHLPPGSPFLHAAVGLGVAAPEMLKIPELAEAFGGVLQSDLKMVESFPYYPNRPPLPIPASIVGIGSDWLVPEPALRAWNELFTEPPRQVRLPGGHLVLHEDEHAFGSVIREELSWVLATNQAPGLPTKNVLTGGGLRASESSGQSCYVGERTDQP